MAWPKVFARLIKTTTATDVEVNRERYDAYPYSKEQEPRLEGTKSARNQKVAQPSGSNATDKN